MWVYRSYLVFIILCVVFFTRKCQLFIPLCFFIRFYVQYMNTPERISQISTTGITVQHTQTRQLLVPFISLGRYNAGSLQPTFYIGRKIPRDQKNRLIYRGILISNDPTATHIHGTYNSRIFPSGRVPGGYLTRPVLSLYLYFLSYFY